MQNMNPITLSKRGEKASETVMRVDLNLYFEAIENIYHEHDNPNGGFPLNVAENKLSWAMLKAKLESISRTQPIPDWVAGYTSTLGLPPFRKALAHFLSKFLTKCPIDPDKMGISPGATGVIEVTAFILGDAGDVAVFPAPCYPVYKNDIGSISGLERYDLITHHELADLQNGLLLDIPHLEKALAALQKAGKCFKMLVLTHPDNPTGGIYETTQLEKIANWCISKEIHLVVNEIYGLSLINTHHPEIANDYAKRIDFQSFAQLMEIKKSPYLHYWYALSKDFGISGFRVGLVYSHNETFIKAYQNINLGHTISNHTQWLLQMLMEDDDFMDDYIRHNQRALTESYVVVVRYLKNLKLPYVPSYGSLFVWLDLSEFLEANTPEAEVAFWTAFYRGTGILLTPGAGFGHTKQGQFRMVFPYISKSDLKVAMERFSAFVKAKRYASQI
jgi:aspartate/methionine/tyrosine aminotransferase